MTPATWEEMADPADEYLQTVRLPTALGNLSMPASPMFSRNARLRLCPTHAACHRAKIKDTSPATCAPHLLQKDASWLFPSRGPDAAEQPAPQENAANAEAVPYRPLRFLRRNKMAPEAGAGSCSPSSSTEDCGAAAGATAVTGTTGGTGAGATPPGSVPAGSAPALSAPASPAPASQPQRPLAFALGALPSSGSAGRGKVPAGSAAQQQQAARPLAGVPTHSFSHLDSSQDLEAGLSGSLGKSSDSLPSAGGKPAGGSASAAPPSRPAFGTLHLKLPGAPPRGSDAGGKQGECGMQCCNC